MLWCFGGLAILFRSLCCAGWTWCRKAYGVLSRDRLPVLAFLREMFDFCYVWLLDSIVEYDRFGLPMRFWIWRTRSFWSRLKDLDLLCAFRDLLPRLLLLMCEDLCDLLDFLSLDFECDLIDRLERSLKTFLPPDFLFLLDLLRVRFFLFWDSDLLPFLFLLCLSLTGGDAMSLWFRCFHLPIL